MPSTLSKKATSVFLNLLLLILPSAILLAGAEFSIRKFAAHRVNTHFDMQTEQALGVPIPPKAKDEYRIFIFGSSAAYGFPVADRYSIAAWLRKSFPHLIKGKTVKVINAAWPGKSSHQVAQGARIVLKYKPDLFIIYTGNNEAVISNRLFTDNALYRLNMKLQFGSAFYRFLSMHLSRLRKHMVYGSSGHVEKQYREEVIANKVYQQADVTEAAYERILNQYAKNLRAVVGSAKRRKVDILFLDLPSNQKEVYPGLSVHRSDLTQDELAAWNFAYEEGKKFETKGDFQKALTSFIQAAGVDSNFAELHHHMGACYEKMGDYAKARKAYSDAVDRDAHPTRGTTRLNALIRKIAADSGHLFLSQVAVLEKVSPHGIISRDMVYDDVHPTVQAQQILSDAILKTLWENNKIAPQEAWDWTAFETARQGVERADWEVDGQLNAYHSILNGLHLWEQKRYPEAAKNLEEGIRLMPSFLESYAFLGDAYLRLGEEEKAVAAFQALSEKDAVLFGFLDKKYPDIHESHSRISDSLMHSQK